MTKNTNKHDKSSTKKIPDNIADNAAVNPEVLASESDQRAGITQDGFCRKILDDQIIAADILRNYADPAIAECIDLDKLQPERTNFFGNVQGNPFKEFRSDIPYTAPLVDDTNGYMVLLLFEHKSILGHFVFIQIYAYM
ncbi:MAG: Rpn family recombination-promoting nuclease/putative transposase, partial [Planctomycetaceae bacterium]|nr:Rpn family recombination-promoting nuclease/putative transposase [Planctomycetaceae bacterium]